ncbi:hypothetical protein D3C74_141390 [compost metagenome]
MEELGFKEEEDVRFAHCIEGKTQLHLHGNGDILISELCYPVIIGNIYHGTSLAHIYEQMPAALKKFLEEEPCPAREALFPAGV